jgi:glucarate dehydratase
VSARGAVARKPAGRGPGSSLTEAKLARDAEVCRELGGYPYDRGPGRPGWLPLAPNDRWADPTDSALPDLRAGE